MRRIYESQVLHRNDDESFTPAESDRTREPQAFRSISETAVSRLLLPGWLRDRAISVTVSTPRSEYTVGSAVPFRVTIRNRLPLPVTISTRSPLLWTWSIDGLTEATQVPLRDPPTVSIRSLRTKTLRREWNGMICVSESEWVPASPGE